MTVSTTTAKSGPYAGSGTTGPFTVGFRFLENSHILVVKNVAGVETNLVLDTDYTVTGAGASSGSVTLATALATGQTLTIVRNVPTTQETDYVAGDSFPAESHERALDQLTMIAQQLKEEVDRSAKLPVSSTADADALVTDIIRLADSADEIDAVADIESSVVTVAGIDSEVATVAGIAANVTTVAGVSGNVTTVAGISSNVTTVAGVAANVTTVAGVSSSVTTVAGISAAVSTVAADGTDIGAVAAISADVQAVADIATDVSAVENIAANVTTVAGIAANVTTVAGISTAVSTVATNAAAVSTVSTNIASVNSAATNMAAIIAAPTEASNAAASAVAAANSAASAATALDSFDDRYLGSKASDPTLDNDGNALITGALYYNTTTQMMKVYDGANWIAATAAGTTSMLVYKYVATAGQTTFSGAATVGGTMSYTSGNIIVFLNGASLDSTDYTATNGTSVVLGSAAALNDELVVVAFKSFTVADTYSIAGADSQFLTKANPSYSGTLTGGTGVINLGSGQFYKDASGNVGLGVTPSSWGSAWRSLDMLAASTVATSDSGAIRIGNNFYYNSSNTATYKSGGYAGYYQYYSGNGQHVWGIAPSGSTGGAITFTQAMTLDSSGNLLVGATSSALSSGKGIKLNANSDFGVVCDSSNGGTSHIHLYNVNATNNGYRFYVLSNGGIANYSGNNSNLSDERTKTNIEVAGGYLDKVCAIPVKLFNYKDEAEGEQRTLGVIAQDVEAVAPELVNQDGWIGEAPEGEAPLKSIYTTDMMFALMKCIQEQQALITTLTERITALENK